MKQWISRTVFAVTAATLWAAPLSAMAQAWPTKQPIKFVAVFPPGGSVDQVARILAVPLSQQLGQNIIVENKGGASGSIGTAAVAAAPGDGYTFAFVFDTHGVNPSLIPGLPFDTRKDLTPVTLIGTSAMVLATFSGSEYKTFADVVAAAKAKKNVSYGSIGSGSLGHLAMALLSKSGNIDWQHIPYKGGGPLMTDAVAGHVPLSIGSVFVTKPHIDSGRLRPLAVTTSKRSPELPNVPTVAESGFTGFDAPAWWAILAPAKTPPDVIKRMSEEVDKALKNPEIAKKLSAQGIEIVGGSSDAARVFIDKQIDTWAKVVKDNGIKAD
ncbi:MAG: tripartite tricarboxylate transporter substrate binding protein [Polaromonas sp.]|uniref:tripartite tricarboxylate transporter substrate binding protein n=1 Tax=Polaromonas sp. TaxID=1869339 RepID=UPI0027311983|nr:tripartite tricarboxylate transporter substrate binding protein [Polaromonas sp.]MDP1742871.1 tripartite tricarboxylate transporter substrate binding protein [Polaromonas sp.]MDP1953633.1 tripartite tricarboxylate transporter substrate binding protein [Polaromonas sp.]MDP3355637.1 tripartite tricarboxylate transporter substrate binding protein [Polaromonas sp.]MDP3753135.1 tripartite tricarboxylate transporter substrate binding protein [Polaromonas sp.]